MLSLGSSGSAAGVLGAFYGGEGAATPATIRMETTSPPAVREVFSHVASAGSNENISYGGAYQHPWYDMLGGMGEFPAQCSKTDLLSGGLGVSVSTEGACYNWLACVELPAAPGSWARAPLLDHDDQLPQQEHRTADGTISAGAGLQQEKNQTSKTTPHRLLVFPTDNAGAAASSASSAGYESSAGFGAVLGDSSSNASSSATNSQELKRLRREAGISTSAPFCTTGDRSSCSYSGDLTGSSGDGSPEAAQTSQSEFRLANTVITPTAVFLEVVEQRFAGVEGKVRGLVVIPRTRISSTSSRNSSAAHVRSSEVEDPTSVVLFYRVATMWWR